MKLFLLSLCLFGVAFADTSRGKWINSSVQNLTLSIWKIAPSASSFARVGIYDFGNRTSDLVTRMVNLRQEISQFPVEKSNSIHPSASESVRAELDAQEQLYQRLRNDYNSVQQEEEMLEKQISRVETKEYALLNAANHLNTSNGTKEDGEQLIEDVKAIIALEKAIETADSNDRPRMEEELDAKYTAIRQAIEPFVSLWEGRPLRAAQRVALMALRLTLDSWFSGEVKPEDRKRVEVLTNAMNPMESAMMKKAVLWPIDNAEKADQMVVSSWEFMGRVRDLEQLLDEQSSN